MGQKFAFVEILLGDNTNETVWTILPFSLRHGGAFKQARTLAFGF